MTPADGATLRIGDMFREAREIVPVDSLFFAPLLRVFALGVLVGLQWAREGRDTALLESQIRQWLKDQKIASPGELS